MVRVQGTKSLEVLPPLIVAHLEKTGGAWTVKELTEYLEYTNSCVIGVLAFMIELGTLDRRRMRADFYFLKDKYDEAQINKMVEDGFHRRYVEKIKYEMKPVRSV